MLHYAAAKGHAAIVAWLLETQAAAGGDADEFVSAFDGGRNTPLHVMARVGNAIARGGPWLTFLCIPMPCVIHKPSLIHVHADI